jgi:hypothetical protein
MELELWYHELQQLKHHNQLEQTQLTRYHLSTKGSNNLPDILLRFQLQDPQESLM